MNCKEAAELLGFAAPAGKLKAALAALSKRSCELRIDSRKLLERPELVFEADAAASRELRALAGALRDRARVRIGGGRSRDRRGVPFLPGCLGAGELDAALTALDRLCPIAEVVAGASGITLIFSRPVPWPFFAALDFARPFEKRQGELAPRLAGRAVASVSLRSGAMELGLV